MNWGSFILGAAATIAGEIGCVLAGLAVARRHWRRVRYGWDGVE